MYLFHRAGLLREISIERASEKNFDAVKRLTEHFSAKEKILNDFNDAVRSRKRSVSRFESNNKSFIFSLQATNAFLDAYIINVATQTSALIIFSNEEVR